MRRRLSLWGARLLASTMMGCSKWAVGCVALALVAGACDPDPGSSSDDDGAGGSGLATSVGGQGAGTSTTQGNGGGDDPCGHMGEAEPAELAGATAAHNAARCAVQTDTPLPPLHWNATVAATAQAYAEVLASQGCDLNHSTTSYGENLFWGTGDYTPQDVVDAWMSEDVCYPGGPFPDACTCTCGHYTQIVWRDTTQVGCGIAYCGQSVVWVCNYDPPGNWVGESPF